MPKLEQDVFFDGQYIPPRFIGSTYRIHDPLSGILWNAQLQGLVEKEKPSELRFLFWVLTLGFKEAHEAFRSGETTPEDQLFIDKLMAAFKSTSPVKHLPRGYLID